MSGTTGDGRERGGGIRVPFCTCGDTECPFNPVNHDQGCTPCIAKNLREREIPTCFFKAAGGKKPTEGWHYEDFAALIESLGAAEER